jgi:hypothetical protein
MRVGSLVASSVRHTIGVGLQALLIAVIVAGIVFAGSIVSGAAPSGADSVFAAKGGNGGGGHGGAGATQSSVITLDQAPGAFALGTPVTFTTTVADLSGNEWAMVYLKCDQAGTVVYGQLDLPGTVFVLGAGSSPWWEVGGTATCVAYLEAYGSHGGTDTIRVLAQTEAFSAN